MNSYVFAVSNNPIAAAYASLEAMSENCEEYFQVGLENDNELSTLMDLLGVEQFPMIMLSSSEDFASLFDYSAYLLPQLYKEDFDAFYDEWLRRSGRETSMDEYGQLIFLQGCGASWNKMAYRFVLRETHAY